MIESPIGWTGIQTILIIFSPFILPRIIPLFTRRSTLPPAPPAVSFIPQTPSIAVNVQKERSRIRQPYRLLLFIIILFFTLPPVLFPKFNVFTSLAPSHNLLQSWYHPLREGLDLRTSTDDLRNRWNRYESSSMSDREKEQLLLRLTSWDNRLLYVNYGARTLFDCEWCQLPLKRTLSSRLASIDDYLLYSLPFIVLEYLVGLVGVGLLAEGRERKKYRVMGVALWIIGLIAEGYVRSSIRSSVGASLPALLIDSTLTIARNLYLTLVCTLLYFLPPATPLVVHSLVEWLLPAIVPLVPISDNTLQRIRVLNFERTTIMSDAEYRAKAVKFWETFEQESILVNADPVVRSKKDALGLRTTKATGKRSEEKETPEEEKVTEVVAKWIDHYLPMPLPLSSPVAQTPAKVEVIRETEEGGTIEDQS